MSYVSRVNQGAYFGLREKRNIVDVKNYHVLKQKTKSEVDDHKLPKFKEEPVD